MTERPAHHDRRAAIAVWAAAVRLVRRHPVALAVPAVVLGMVSELAELLPAGVEADEVIAVAVSTYFYFLFIAYVERVSHRGADRRISPRRVLLMLREVARPAVAVAAVGTLVLIGASLGFALLIVPGVWLITRTALTVPAMVMEDLGPAAAVRRSLALTRGHFWLALATAGAVLIGEVVAESFLSVLTASPLEDGGWGRWVLGGLLSAALLCLTAPVVSEAYARLAHDGAARPRARVRPGPPALTGP